MTEFSGRLLYYFDANGTGPLWLILPYKSWSMFVTYSWFNYHYFLYRRARKHVDPSTTVFTKETITSQGRVKTSAFDLELALCLECYQEKVGCMIVYILTYSITCSRSYPVLIARTPLKVPPDILMSKALLTATTRVKESTAKSLVQFLHSYM